MATVLAGKNGDVKASIDELLEDGRAEIASGLGEIPRVSVLERL